MALKYFKSKNHALALSGLIAFLIMVAGTLAFHDQPFNSDDVAHQTILHLWSMYGVSGTWLPPDSFLDKYPVFILVNLLHLGPRTALFLAAGLMVAILAAGVYLFLFLCVRQEDQKIGAQNFKRFIFPTFICSLPLGFIFTLRNPNGRNMEIGLFYALLGVYVNLLHRKSTKIDVRSCFITAVSALGLGFLYYSDPYFLLPGIGFVVALVACRYWFFVRGQRALKSDAFSILCGGAIILSVLSYMLYKHVANSFGITYYSLPIVVPTFPELISRCLDLPRGIADVFTLGANNTPRWLVLGGLVSLGLGIKIVATATTGIVRKIRTQTLGTPDVVVCALLLELLLLFASYVLTQNHIDPTTMRYLVVAPILVLILAILVDPFRGKVLGKYSAILLVAIVLCNLLPVTDYYHTLKALVPADYPLSKKELGNKSNFYDKQIVAALEAKGLTKGYAGYWDAHITTAMSQNKILVLPILCDGKKIKPFYWVTQDKAYHGHPGKTFIIFDNKQLPSTACNITYLGGYSDEFNVAPDTMVRVYDYDIGARFPKRTNFTTPV